MHWYTNQASYLFRKMTKKHQIKKYKEISNKQLIDVLSEEDQAKYIRWANATEWKKPQPVHWLFMPIDYLVDIVDEVPLAYRGYISKIKYLRDTLGLETEPEPAESESEWEMIE